MKITVMRRQGLAIHVRDSRRVMISEGAGGGGGWGSRGCVALAAHVEEREGQVRANGPGTKTRTEIGTDTGTETGTKTGTETGTKTETETGDQDQDRDKS